jgi:hypothetical protein
MRVETSKVKKMLDELMLNYSVMEIIKKARISNVTFYNILNEQHDLTNFNIAHQIASAFNYEMTWDENRKVEIKKRLKEMRAGDIILRDKEAECWINLKRSIINLEYLNKYLKIIEHFPVIHEYMNTVINSLLDMAINAKTEKWSPETPRILKEILEKDEQS